LPEKIVISRNTEQRFNLAPNLPAGRVDIDILHEYVWFASLDRSTLASKNNVLTPFDINLGRGLGKQCL